jgi:hypothetical protein
MKNHAAEQGNVKRVHPKLSNITVTVLAATRLQRTRSGSIRNNALRGHKTASRTIAIHALSGLSTFLL